MDLIERLCLDLEKSRAEGNVFSEHGVILTLLDILMSEVVHSSDLVSGPNFLVESKVVDYLQRFPELVEQRADAISAGDSNRQIGDFNIYPTLVCLGWLLDRDDVARRIIEVTNRLMSLSYYMGGVENRILDHVAAYMDAKVLEPQIFPRMPKIDKPYVYYANLMNAIITGENIDAAIKAVDKNFKERNKDMKANEPAPRILGTGQAPANWDVWREAILSYGRRHYNYND